MSVREICGRVKETSVCDNKEDLEKLNCKVYAGFFLYESMFYPLKVSPIQIYSKNNKQNISDLQIRNTRKQIIEKSNYFPSDKVRWW